MTDDHTPDAPASSALRRALPRVTGALVGSALVAGSDGGPTIAIGITVLMLSVMTNPVRWWRYVMTGSAPTPPAAGYTQPGSCTVQLQSPGPRPIEVVKALREVTAADLSAAKSLIDRAPALVVGGLSEASAARVRDRLEAAGATATVLTDDV